MIPTDFKNLTRRDTSRDREARRRAAAAVNLFGGPAGQNGVGLNFNAMGAPAPSSDMGVSFADAYAPPWKAEQAEKDARAARLDKLPVAVAKLATEQGVTDIQLLEIVAIVERGNKIMNGPVQAHRGDIARAIGVTADKAEALMTEAARRGFIEPRANSYWRCKL